jgi:photosystem II stability/assembly factor-like uncharacterized protein
VFFINQNEGWIGGWKSLLHTTNGGITWASQIYMGGMIYGIHFADTENGWALGANSLSYRTTDGGTNWFEEPIGINSNINAIYFIDIHNGWAVGDNGIVLQWGNSGTTSVKGQRTSLIKLPSDFKLSQNYPEPFNPSTTISFSLPSKFFVSLKIFDLLGREVATIVSEEMSAGSYSRQWTAINMPSGVYFYRLQAGSFTEAKKLILLK